MDTSPLELTPAQREALLAQPDAPVYIADRETRKVYMLVEKGRFPELEEDYVRAKLEEGFAAIDRGEVEDWDAASIKSAGRQILSGQRPIE
jgi:hypothetical protein